MFETGQFLLPMDNYQLWLDKPILAFWIIAGLFKAFGVNTFAGRLVSAVPAILLGVLIYFGSRPFLHRRTCFLASVIFLASPLVSVIGHSCLTDMLLCLLVSGCLFSFAVSLLNESSTKALVIAYLTLGLAVLCKGPIAIVLVAATLILYMVLTEPSRTGCLHFLKSLKPLMGIVLVSVINLPWYAAAMVVTHGRFFYDFFIRQNFGRMVGTVNHQNPWWYYIPVLVAGLFPWSLYAFAQPALFKQSLKEGKSSMASKSIRYTLFCLCWALVVLILFGVLKTKLPTYILPALPAIAILIALQIDCLMRMGGIRRLLFIGFIVLASGVCVLVFKQRIHGFAGYVLNQYTWLLAIIVCGLGANCLFLLLKKIKMATAVLMASIVVASAVLVPLGLAAEFKERQQGFNDLVLRAKANNAHLAILFAEQHRRLLYSAQERAKACFASRCSGIPD